MIQIEYTQKLQNWVLTQAPREKRGSLADLHRRFLAVAGSDAISKSNISYWRDGKLDGPLSQRSLEQLAAVRGESIATTKAWLEGRPAPQESAAAPLTTQARAAAVDQLPALIEQASAIANEAMTAIQIASLRMRESSAGGKLGELMAFWRAKEKPHWNPFKPLSPERIEKERRRPWSAEDLAQIVNREFGLVRQYSAEDIKKLESGRCVDRSLIRLIASLKFVLDGTGQPMSDVALLELAEQAASHLQIEEFTSR
jgi:hypothetical protein